MRERWQCWNIGCWGIGCWNNGFIGLLGPGTASVEGHEGQERARGQQPLHMRGSQATHRRGFPLEAGWTPRPRRPPR